MKKIKYPIMGYIVFATISTLVWIFSELELLPKLVGIIAAGLGLLVTLLGVLSFFYNNFQEEIRKEFTGLKKFFTKKIYVREEFKRLKSLIIKKICVSICDYTQYSVFIDFAQEDKEFAKKIEQNLKKEGIKGITCDSTTNNLEHNLRENKAIVTLYYEVPESWIRNRNTIYRRELVLPKVILCTNKNNVKKLFEKAEMLDSTELDYHKLLTVIKDKFKKS